MRPVFPSDLDAVTRTLLAVPETARAGLAAEIVRRAGVADRHRRRRRIVHPIFGTGTLSSAAQLMPRALRPRDCDADYLRALALLIVALQDAAADQSA